MIIKQRFNRGTEIQNGEEFFAALPDDPAIQEAVEEVLKVIENSVTYERYFVLQIDTVECSANVVEAI